MCDLIKLNEFIKFLLLPQSMNYIVNSWDPPTS